VAIHEHDAYIEFHDAWNYQQVRLYICPRCGAGIPKANYPHTNFTNYAPVYSAIDAHNAYHSKLDVEVESLHTIIAELDKRIDILKEMNKNTRFM